MVIGLIFARKYAIRYTFCDFKIYDRGGVLDVPAADPYHKQIEVAPRVIFN